MKYFKLETSLNMKEIGNYPQIQDFKKGYDVDKKESCSQIARYYFFFGFTIGKLYFL